MIRLSEAAADEIEQRARDETFDIELLIVRLLIGLWNQVVTGQDPAPHRC